MWTGVGKFYEECLVRWTGWVAERPKRVILASVFFTLFCCLYLAQNIAVDTSTGDMLSEELDFRKFNKEMDEAFPEVSEGLLVVIDADTFDQADAAAIQLSNEMRAQPALYGDIYDLAGEPYFRKNGLLYLDVDALYDLSDQLAEAQPFLASLWKDPTLTGLLGLLEKAIEQRDPDGASGVEITPFLENINRIATAQLANQPAQLSWRALMQGDADGENRTETQNRRFLLVHPSLDFGSLHPASDAMDGIRNLVERLNLIPEAGIRVRLSGSAALEQEELESVEEGMGLAGVLSFVLVMGLLIAGLRQAWLVFSCLATLIVGLIGTAAFAIAALGALNLISVAFAVLFIGLSVDFGIHYTLRYVEQATEQNKGAVSLGRASRSVGRALSLSALAAAIAFYSFLPTAYDGLAELGLIAGTGMFVALFANLTLLPALLVLRPVTQRSRSQILNVRTQTPSLFTAFINRNRKAVIFSFLGAGALALLAIPLVEFDFDPLNLKNRQTESMSTLIDLMNDPRTSPYSIEVLTKDLQAADDLATKLGNLNQVKSAETVLDFIPQDQEEKLDVIASMSLFLAPAFSDEWASSRSVTPAREALVQFIEVLRANPSLPAPPDMAAQLTEISGLQGGAEELEDRLLVHLPAQLHLLKQSLEAAPVSLDDLPEGLRTRKIAKDGRVIVDVYPAADVTDRQQLIEFVEAVRSVAPRAIGAPVVILEAGKAILGAFYQAGLISVCLIACMLYVVLRRVRDIALVFAPLLLAGIFTLAASGVFGLAFNFANVIVLPLLFGLGVAGGIHLVLRNRVDGDTADTSTTPRAVLFSALTTMGSFGSIALSSHPGTASMGLLLTITITLTLICTLVFLPALLYKTRP